MQLGKSSMRISWTGRRGRSGRGINTSPVERDNIQQTGDTIKAKNIAPVSNSTNVTSLLNSNMRGSRFEAYFVQPTAPNVADGERSTLVIRNNQEQNKHDGRRRGRPPGLVKTNLYELKPPIEVPFRDGMRKVYCKCRHCNEPRTKNTEQKRIHLVLRCKNMLFDEKVALMDDANSRAIKKIDLDDKYTEDNVEEIIDRPEGSTTPQKSKITPLYHYVLLRQIECPHCRQTGVQ